MENKKMLKSLTEDLFITQPKFDIYTSVEGGGEYTMPDYYPPIRKLIGYTADILPDTKFLSGDALEYGGTLVFNMLYIGEDGAIVSLPYSCEYSGNQVLPKEVRGTGDVYIEASVEDVQCRVLAKRKVSFKARAAMRICADEKIQYKLTLADDEGNELTSLKKSSVQRLSHTLPVLSRGRGFTTANVTGEMPDSIGAKPISCTGSVSVSSVTAAAETVTVKGDISVRCLVFAADGTYKPLKAKLPFEEIILCNGVKAVDSIRAWGRVASVSASIVENSGIEAEIEYDLECEWLRQGDVSIITDCYSTVSPSTLERKPINALSPVCCFNTTQNLSANGKRTVRSQMGEYIIDASCSAKIEKAEQTGNRVIINGICNAKVYIAVDGEVICEEVNLPFKTETSAMTEGAQGKLVTSAFISVPDINCKLDGDSISVSAELCISAACMRENNIEPVCRISIAKEENAVAATPQVKVYYPSENESLWEIGKKYNASASILEDLNGIKRECVTGGKPVIIPLS